MSNRADKETREYPYYKTQNDPTISSGDIPENPYMRNTRRGASAPIQRGERAYEDPRQQPPYSNGDEQWAVAEEEGIDPSNILKGDRLRHAKVRTGSSGYEQGVDEADLPEEVTEGTSSGSRARPM